MGSMRKSTTFYLICERKKKYFSHNEILTFFETKKHKIYFLYYIFFTTFVGILEQLQGTIGKTRLTTTIKDLILIIYNR